MLFGTSGWILQRVGSGYDVEHCVNRSLLNLAAPGSSFYISISSVGKPNTCIPISTDKTEKEQMVLLFDFT